MVIFEQTYYWRKKHGRLSVDQARRFKELEKENVRLKRLVADFNLNQEIYLSWLTKGKLIEFNLLVLSW